MLQKPQFIHNNFYQAEKRNLFHRMPIKSVDKKDGIKTKDLYLTLPYDQTNEVPLQ